MADVVIQLQGLTRAIRALQQMGDRTSNFGPIARDLMLVVQADVDQRFDSAPGVEEGGVVFGGVEWPHLSDRYLNANPRRVGGQLLRDTGELLQSYSLGGAGNIATATPDQITFGSNLPKARGLAERRPQVFVHRELVDNASRVVAFYLNGDI